MSNPLGSCESPRYFLETHMDTNTTTTPRAAWSVSELCARFGVSKGKVFLELKEGRLKRVKFGRRTLIPVESAEAWWQSLQMAG